MIHCCISVINYYLNLMSDEIMGSSVLNHKNHSQGFKQVSSVFYVGPNISIQIPLSLSLSLSLSLLWIWLKRNLCAKCIEFSSACTIGWPESKVYLCWTSKFFGPIDISHFKDIIYYCTKFGRRRHIGKEMKTKLLTFTGLIDENWKSSH